MHPLEALTTSVLDAVARGEADGTVDAVDVRFLLRRYIATDGAPLRDALGRALAVVLARPLTDGTLAERADRLLLFAETSTLSDDDRLRTAAADLVNSLADESSRAARTADAMRALDACLHAVSLGIAQGSAAAIVDRLEEVVARAYRPGHGIAPAPDDADAPTLPDQISSASALLTAHEATARLPYAMLAEELVQSARRWWWAEDTGAFRDSSSGEMPLDVNCAAARVLCRLATLHRDAAYTSAAVVSPSADYRRDADRILIYFRGATAAAYAIALAEYVDLQ